MPSGFCFLLWAELGAGQARRQRVCVAIARHAKRGFAISPRMAREFGWEIPYPPIRGRRECRAPDAPDSRACNGSGRTHTR